MKKSMVINFRRPTTFLSLIALMLPLIQFSAAAGPPLVCHQIDIGTATSLPAGDGPFGMDRDYKPGDLSAATLALLDAEQSVLVRMETIRRAVLYVTRALYGVRHGRSYTDADRRNAAALFLAFETRKDAARAAKEDAARCLFDYAYLAACLRQAGIDHTGSQKEQYAMLSRASAELGAEPALDFAMALLSYHPRLESFAVHLKRAQEGASADGLLAGNIARHFEDELAEQKQVN